MDVIFALAYREKISPVKIAFRKDIPEAGTPEADAILGLSGDDSESGSKDGDRI